MGPQKACWWWPRSRRAARDGWAGSVLSQIKGHHLYPAFVSPVNPSRVSQVTMLTAVALASAIRSETGVGAGSSGPTISLVDGRKVCGILAELSAEVDRIGCLVVGIGINANQDFGDFPEDIRTRPPR